MSPELIFNLVVIIGAALTIPIARARNGTWLTVGLLFSCGWLSTIIFYRYLNVVVEGGYEIPITSFEFGAKIVFWGYVGVILGHLAFAPRRTRYREFLNYFSDIGAFLDKYYLWICGIVFVLGMVSLFDRLSSVGFSIYVLADLRHDHVNTRFSFFQRFSIYGGIILGIFVVLGAIDDNLKERVNIKRIGAVIVALLPLALSKASRQEFMTPITTYVVTTFLVVQLRLILGHKIKWGLLWRMYAKFLPLGLALLFVFTVYGQLRSVGSKQMGGRYELFALVDAPLQLSVSISSWFASSFYSVGPITEFEDVTFPRMNGRITLEPIFKVPEKLRLIPNKSYLVYLARQDAFNKFGTAQIAYTPGTMGKVLTREFGKDLAPYFAGLMMFVFVGLANLWSRNSIVGFIIVFTFSSQILMSFQTLQGFNMIVAWRIFFALIFTYCYAKFRRNRVGICRPV